jgi:hypothetical protein
LEVHNLSPEADSSLVEAAKDALAEAARRSPSLQEPVLELSLAAACPLPGTSTAADCRRAPANLPSALLETAAQMAFDDCRDQPQGLEAEWCLRRYRLTLAYQFKDGQFRPREDSVPPPWRPALRASARDLALPCTALRLRLPVLFRIED